MCIRDRDVGFGPRNLGLDEDTVKARVREALSQVGLGEDILEKSPFELSGGQKRRVAIAGVLAMKPVSYTHLDVYKRQSVRRAGQRR